MTGSYGKQKYAIRKVSVQKYSEQLTTRIGIQICSTKESTSLASPHHIIKDRNKWMETDGIESYLGKFLLR